MEGEKSSLSIFREPRNVIFGMCADGVSPFTVSQKSFSMLCIILQLCNLPADLRKTYENLLIRGIVEGAYKAKLVFRIYVGDVATLWKGVGVYDAFQERTFTCYGLNMNCSHDYPGFTSTSMQSAHDAIGGCVRCNICGTHVPALNTVVYARRLQEDPEADFIQKDKAYLLRARTEMQVCARNV